MPDGFADLAQRQRLDERVAVITGAAQGMGSEHAWCLAARGAAVVLVDINDADGEQLATDLRERGAQASYVHGDVSEVDSWQQIRTASLEAFGAVHILVNNAGLLSHRRIRNTRREGWERLLAVNLKGPAIGMQLLAPDIRDAGGGAIINVSSAAGLDHHPDPAYTASKWGLRGLTKTAAQELGPWGIRVNSVHPGYIDTPMNDFASDELRAAKTALLPVGRAGQAWEVGELVAFLASDAAAFITGAEIAVDGGWTSGVQATEARRVPAGSVSGD
ncbi:3alpha(or 20beta)-hydroxysteroid dehydrogenase [Nakamurella panacisegetis]|uniref:3alpha(Or 20beta)-hydroxysteroid dehydrogenase n=1 Tax=Nakamurella panacisegetis TaxID=1090615 RepID=A0A1H0LA04_9ACTN|nr:glucose 1-dehydrogenase [Nakamurella panacisegetis]SDO65074.1 3alpha(or 20beta)-hydroxysteroid dehydrogenase [Nakamurella panacisegetis]